MAAGWKEVMIIALGCLIVTGKELKDEAGTTTEAESITEENIDRLFANLQILEKTKHSECHLHFLKYSNSNSNK